MKQDGLHRLGSLQLSLAVHDTLRRSIAKVVRLYDPGLKVLGSGP